MSDAMTMAGMPMPGGWTMSMAWMRMPGQSWLEAAASFVGMWSVMMLPMMVPAVAPTLWRFRKALAHSGATSITPLTVLAAVGYFAVWTAIGLLIYPVGAALATIEMQQPQLARLVPLLSGMVVLAAGALQFTAWKARQLACCRGASLPNATGVAERAVAAIRHGVRLGINCARCCAGPMVVLLVLGVMDVGAMIIVGAAITVERLAPAGERAARMLGGVAVAAALLLMADAIGLG